MLSKNQLGIRLAPMKTLENGQFSTLNPKMVLANDFAQAVIIMEEFSYNYRNQLIITVPRGFYTDGISSPVKFNNAWYGIQKHGPYAMAGYVHDRLYFNPFAYDIKLGAEVKLTRKQCDQIFRHACQYLSCPSWRANIATVCLYAAGWVPFGLHRLKEKYRYAQAWYPDRSSLLYAAHPKYPQRLKKVTVRDLDEK